MGLLSAAIFVEPWNQNQVGDNYNLTGMDFISANTFNGTNGIFDSVTAIDGLVGPINSSEVKNPPSACPGSSAITQFNENFSSATCSDLWVDVDGSFTVGFTEADYIVDGTDDHIQIQQAINEISTTTVQGQSFYGAGKIIIKNGTYDIGDTIIINKSNIMLEGSGWGTILRAKNSLNKTMIEVGDGSTTYRNIIISDIQIDGNRPNQAGVNSRGIYFNTNIQRSIIRNVFVYRTSAKCIYLFQSADNLVTGNYIEDCGDMGITLSGGGRSKIIGNTIDTVQGVGIQVFLENDGIINDNIILTSFQHGLQIVGSSYISINGNTIEDSSFGANNTYDGISLEPTGGINSTYNSLVGNVITNEQTVDGNNRTQFCIDELDTGQDFNIMSGIICKGAISGIRIQGTNTLNSTLIITNA